jgi:hypothetical protein
MGGYALSTTTEEAKRQMQATDVWAYRDRSELGFDPTSGKDLTGYEVEALDGSIGKVDEATYDARHNFVIVDTGPWIFGKKVMVPAGVIQQVDESNETIRVNRSKDQIKAAPEYVESMHTDPGYRADLGTYYGAGGQGFRDDWS